MSKRSRYFCGLAGGMLLSVLTGCIDLSYTGQSFPPLEGEPVAFYSEKASRPDNEYRAIGRILLTAPDGTRSEKLQERLIEAAREHGANAVEVVEFKRVQVGLSAAPEVRQDNAIAQRAFRDNRNAAGERIYLDSFGERASLVSPPRKVYEIQIKALLLVTNVRYNEYTAKYKAQLEKIEKELQQSLKDPVNKAEMDKKLDEKAPAELPPAQPPAPKKPAERPLELNLRDGSQDPAKI